jgi:nitrile hydratase
MAHNHSDDHGHDHHHDEHGGHHHPGAAPPSALEERVRRLEAVLVGKGLLDPAAIDALIDVYENKVGPRNGAQVVARSWTDPDFRARLLKDATAAIAELGFGGRQGEHMVAVENTPQTHNLVVCTLCSCYPWPVLGVPPAWYKSPAYRARAVSQPRSVLAEFGVSLHEGVNVDVWDSTAEIRYLVIPMRPAGTDGWSEDRLAGLVTRDSMIGTGLAVPPEAS